MLPEQPPRSPVVLIADDEDAICFSRATNAGDDRRAMRLSTTDRSLASSLTAERCLQ